MGETDLETISKFLRNSGLEKIAADALSVFCLNAAIPIIDAQTISRMNKETLRNVTLFVLNRMILYNDYDETPFTRFVEMTGFSDNKLAARVLRFLENNLIMVARRDISPSTLERKLHDSYDIPQKLVSEIVNPIRDNISEMHQAYMQKQINELFNIFSSITSGD